MPQSTGAQQPGLKTGQIASDPGAKVGAKRKIGGHPPVSSLRCLWLQRIGRSPRSWARSLIRTAGPAFARAGNAGLFLRELPTRSLACDHGLRGGRERALGRRPKTSIRKLCACRLPRASLSQKFGRLRLVPKSGLSAELLGDDRIAVRRWPASTRSRAACRPKAG